MIQCNNSTYTLIMALTNSMKDQISLFLLGKGGKSELILWYLGRHHASVVRPLFYLIVCGSVVELVELRREWIGFVSD